MSTKYWILFCIIFSFPSAMFAFEPLNNGRIDSNRSNPDSIPFAPKVDYPTATAPISIFVSDFDGDSDFDLAVANGFVVSILKNNGDGTFVDKADYNTGGGDFPLSVFAADLDGDKDQDLVTTNLLANTVSVLKNQGDGTFEPPVYFKTVTGPSSVFATDLDGDGDNDLAVTSYFYTYIATGDTLSVLKNNGLGTFGTYVEYEIGWEATSVFASDLDSDGDQDLIVTTFYDNRVSVLMNNGDGSLTAKTEYWTNGVGPISVFASDLDGDGDNDLAVPHYGKVIDPGEWVPDSAVSVLKNNGDGTFDTVVRYLTGPDPISVFATDLDGDGDKDLVTANHGYFISWFIKPGKTISVLKNNGDGTFATKVDYLTGTSPISVFASDLDLDGDHDVVVANHGGNSVSVLKNLTLGCSAYPGDANGDFKILLPDIIKIINFLYRGQPAPNPVCRADVDADGYILISDIVYLINFLFKSGPAPVKSATCCL